MKRVWCVAYDDMTPRMDGTYPAIRTKEFLSPEEAQQAYEILEARSAKFNLRIECRFVGEWQEVPT